MKIGVVAYEMEGARTGVGRYLEGLLSGVAETDCSFRWQLFFKGEPFEHGLFRDDPRFVPVFDGRPGARPILWEQLRLPRLLGRAGLDVLFSPGYSLPRLPRVPSIVTVHDLSFERLPGEFDFKERWRRRFLARRAARRASRVLADTGEIARELEHTYGLPAAKIGVVPIGLDPRFFQGSSAEDDLARLAPHGVEPPYLLFFGSMLDRRRLDLVIGAFADAAPGYPALRLVLAGQNRLHRPRDLGLWIAGSGVSERIRVLGYVAEEAVAALYRRAELTHYLSSYEGYGLPPLESLALGTPAVVGGALALDDLWPGYPYRCARLDRRTVSETTLRALADGAERRRLGEEGAGRMARLDWKRSAELFLAEVERAVAS
jgi:alpha-1,3-rhamnosyl/mannosyltransferase